MKAVVLAAGQSTRLSQTIAGPKQLVQIGEFTLIEHVLRTAARCDVEEIIVVTCADNHAALHAAVAAMQQRTRCPVVCLCSEHAALGNGASCVDALSAADDDCLVFVSDHVLSTRTMDTVIQLFAEHRLKRLPMLACDPNVDGIFDLPDATKVKVQANCIMQIGKDLSDYDWIDMGIFYLPHNVHADLQHACHEGAHSLTELVRIWLQTDRFLAVPVADACWQDVDDIDMLTVARERFAN